MDLGGIERTKVEWGKVRIRLNYCIYWLFFDFDGGVWKRGWWPERESNLRHTDFQSVALPTELSGR
jgi:hypothetical protein